MSFTVVAFPNDTSVVVEQYETYWEAACFDSVMLDRGYTTSGVIENK